MSRRAQEEPNPRRVVDVRAIFRVGLQVGMERQPYPGTPEEFAEFLGTTIGRLEELTFVQMEGLPTVKRWLVPRGGGRRLGEATFSWETTDRSGHDLWRKGEVFIGRGATYNEAALRGLLTFWELATYRRRQSAGEEE